MNRVPIASWNPTRDVWEVGQMDLLSGHSDVFKDTPTLAQNSVIPGQLALFGSEVE